MSRTRGCPRAGLQGNCQHKEWTDVRSQDKVKMEVRKQVARREENREHGAHMGNESV